LVKLLSGGALLMIALLMVVGFLRADVDAAAPATLVAVLIAIVLPAAGGVALLASHFGAGRRIHERREQLRRQTLEAEILRLAAQRDGRLTVVEVVTEMAVTPEAATESLNALMVRDLAEIEVTDSGVLVYAFRDIQRLAEKARAREILDA
jgi:hypothetical protein